MGWFKRKREEKQFLQSVQSRDMRGEQQFLTPLHSREVIPGRKWEYLDDNGEVVAEQIVHDPEAYRRFVEAMNGNHQEQGWLHQPFVPDVTEE